MKKTAFITGITGQDGSYLAELLLKKKYQVVGLVSSKYNIGNQNIREIKDKVVLEKGDLLDKKSLKRIIKKYQPKEIYNLAGLTFVPDSWERPSLVMDINTLGLARIIEIIKDDFPKTRLYQASSSKIFGNPKKSSQNEEAEIQPTDPYSISKVASHFLIKNLRKKFGLFLVSGILFNHESPRRGVNFVSRKITLSAAKISLGLEKELSLGNLEARQDWGWAPDYVEAMWLILQQNKPDDFIIATGKLHKVKDICSIAFSTLGLDWKKYVKVDKRFFRKEEVKPAVGNINKAKKILSWQPKTSFEKMIKIMVRKDLDFLCQTCSRAGCEKVKKGKKL